MAAPKLRFKEFDGDLAESKLVDSTSWASGGTPAKNIPEYWGDDIPLISGASMHTNQLYESDVKITKLGLQKGSKLAPKDSILILVRGSMLFNKIPMGITLGDVAFNQDVKCIRPKQELAPLFLFQWLYAKENTIQNKVTATGIGAGKLDTADLQNLKLYKPSSEEQTKIASFLSSVDEKISQLTQKYQLLSQYKQGMMQKLFSQQIRFKADDGSEFGEWEETTLKDCVTSIDSGWSPQCESYSTDLNEWGVLKTTSVDWKGFNASFNKKLPDQLTPRLELEVQPLDILVTRAGPTDRVGVVSIVPENVRSKLMISDKLIRLKTNEKNNPTFLGISLSSVKCQNQLQSKTSGLAKSQTNISQKILGDVVLKLPSKEEQTKIANFLSSIDQKIEVVVQQIEQAKQWKKGLLQQMFV